ncbi:MAG: hypothetical protein IPM57_07085 [Oligoflexia bacterium]|nr:hypothetical protein [Oligoflexia bacterium]
MKPLRTDALKKGKDVLLALKQYGPLTRKTLQLVVPTIKDERNFRRTLARLSEKSLIQKRYELINGAKGTIYQLNQDLHFRNILSQLLECQPDDLKQREFR